MTSRRFDAITTLTFDIFGTVLDLTGSLEEPTGQFLKKLGSDVSGPEFYAQWRARQRIEQFQDSLMGLGHSGYLETCRRALVYTLRMNDIAFRSEQADELMKAWQCLNPHPDAVACGYSGAFVNRYGLPYEDTTRYVPALEVNDFIKLADALLEDS